LTTDPLGRLRSRRLKRPRPRKLKWRKTRESRKRIHKMTKFLLLLLLSTLPSEKIMNLQVKVLQRGKGWSWYRLPLLPSQRVTMLSYL